MNKYLKYLILFILLCSLIFIYFYKDIKGTKINNDIKENKENVTLIEFMTLTCPACKELAPIIEDIKKEYGEKVNIKVVDANKNRELASKYEIMYVPTLIFLDKDGNLYKKEVGVMPKDKIIDIFKEMGVK